MEIFWEMEFSFSSRVDSYFFPTPPSFFVSFFSSFSLFLAFFHFSFSVFFFPSFFSPLSLPVVLLRLSHSFLFVTLKFNLNNSIKNSLLYSIGELSLFSFLPSLFRPLCLVLGLHLIKEVRI